jgi:hypothetical protein
MEKLAGSGLWAVTGKGLSKSGWPKVPSACCCRTVRCTVSKSIGVAMSVAMMSSRPPACFSLPEQATSTTSTSARRPATVRPKVFFFRIS